MHFGYKQQIVINISKFGTMDKESERWNYKPPGKVQLNPIFSRSIRIRIILSGMLHTGFNYQQRHWH